MNKLRIHYVTVLLGVAQIFAWASTYYLPAAFASIVAKEINQSYLFVIGGFSWALLLGGLSAPKIGAWIDLEGGRRPLALGSLLMGSGLLVLSQAHGLLVWYLGWTITGLGMALGLFNAAFATIGRLLGQDAKTIIIRITLISGFATLFWPLTTFLIGAYGWRAMVLLYALPHLLVWAPLYFFTIPDCGVLQKDETPSVHQVKLEKVKQIFYLLAVYSILRAIVGTTISVNIISMFEGIGIALGAAAMTASLIGPSQIVGRLLEMYMGSKFDPVNSSLFWSAVLPMSIFILLFVGPTSASFFAVAYGMSNGVLTITMGILPMILFGSKGYATMLGKLALPVLFAQAATPLLLALIVERWPSPHIFALAALLGMVALIALLVLAWIAKRSKNIAMI